MKIVQGNFTVEMNSDVYSSELIKIGYACLDQVSRPEFACVRLVCLFFLVKTVVTLRFCVENFAFVVKVTNNAICTKAAQNNAGGNAKTR